MTKHIKIILAFILAIIISVSISVYATITYTASQVTYGNTTVEGALNSLYTSTSENETTINNLQSQLNAYKICQYVGNTYGNSNNHYSLGTEYLCDVNLNGQNKKNFYILNVKGDTVTLIAKQNVTQETSKTTYTWIEAMSYVRNMTWKVSADLPKAQDIANAVGNTSWHVEEKDYANWFCFGGNYAISCGSNSGTLQNDSNTIKYRWLFNYTRECTNSGCLSSTSLGSTEAYGYWTRDIVAQNNDSNEKHRAWRVNRLGDLNNNSITSSGNFGIRPTITVLKTNLYE